MATEKETGSGATGDSRFRDKEKKQTKTAREGEHNEKKRLSFKAENKSGV